MSTDANVAELHALMSEIRNLEGNVVLARMNWARQHGITHNGRRDTYEVFGYDDVITTGQYRAAYDRGGIAGSVVDVMPEATWRGETPFEIIEDENKEDYTPFEQAWVDLEKKHQIFAKLQRADKLSRLSTYGVLLIGAPGDWSEELPKATKAGLLYLMPFLGGGGPGANNQRTAATDNDATVFEYETRSSDPRFGLPISYTLKRTDVASPDWGRPVHWTRVIHIAEGLLDNEVFGQPALERVWNLLTDLNKVTGGGAEAFWLRANQGLHLDIDKDMGMEGAAETVAALKEQAEAYKHQLTRWLRTRGVNVQTLGSDVANFGPPADTIITQIAGAKRIPKRILTGSEMGELASSQDRENFRDQVIGRQTQYAAPYIIRPLVDRLIEYGYLPSPKKETGYTVKWPHIQVMTEQEKVTGAQGWAATNQSYGDTVYTDAEIRQHWFDLGPLSDEQRKEISDRAMNKAKQAQEVMQMTAPPEDKPPSEKLRAAQEGKDYKLSSTQIQIPPALAEEIRSYARGIPVLHWCEEEGGIEEDIHITVKYGIHTNDVAEIRKALATYVGPIRFTLGKVAMFYGDGYEVLYIAVNSPDLEALNQRIADSVEVTDTHPVYVPHITLGYLKKGLGAQYVGDSRFEGMSSSVGFVRFSPAEGSNTDLKITGRNEKGSFAVAQSRPELAEDVELVGLLAAALEVGNGEVVSQIVGLGGPGSGNFGHTGRPGMVGGSGDGGSATPLYAGPLFSPKRSHGPTLTGEISVGGKKFGIGNHQTKGGSTVYQAFDSRGREVATARVREGRVFSVGASTSEGKEILSEFDDYVRRQSTIASEGKGEEGERTHYPGLSVGTIEYDLGVAIDKLTEAHGTDWAAKLTKIREEDQLGQLIRGELDEKLGLKVKKNIYHEFLD